MYSSTNADILTAVARFIVLFCILLAASCGRIGYEPLAPVDSGDGGVDNPADVQGDASPDSEGPVPPGNDQAFDPEPDEDAEPEDSDTSDSQPDAPPECDPACSCTLYDEHTYMFCAASRTWDEAAAHCRAFDMWLVRIDSQEEQDWVYQHVIDLGFGDRSRLWLGANDQAVEGEWRWHDGELFWLGGADGSPIGGLYNAWPEGNPDNWTGGDLPEENCAELRMQLNDWNDYRCNATYRYACEHY